MKRILVAVALVLSLVNNSTAASEQDELYLDIFKAGLYAGGSCMEAGANFDKCCEDWIKRMQRVLDATMGMVEGARIQKEESEDE